MTEVVGIKLISGIELIGKCTFTGSEYHVEDALMLTISPAASGLNVGFAPIAMLASDGKAFRDLVLDKVQVLCPFPVHEDCQKAYLSQVSGIAISTSLNNVKQFTRN